MNNFNEIKVITFDGDGTLWDFEKVMRHSLKFVLAALNEIDSEAGSKLDVDMLIVIRNKVAKDLKGITTNLEDIRLQAFIQTLNYIGRPNEELAKFLNEIYLKHRFEDIELFDDVLQTLTQLKKKYTIGLLSNGSSYPDRCGLENIFNFVIFSQDFGIEKPDPRIFEITMKKAQCKVPEILHIGDSLETDIQGAKNVGIKNIWLNRNNVKNNQHFKPDREITSLIELLDFL
ncbi:MAG TPA: HAD family hydrolase [Candidatus Bathyarchaeia archaeon]|nr:HAD family hydrolase [Candidatus Bathyarchaeia archaeon]